MKTAQGEITHLFSFLVPGKVVPYVRMTQRSKYKDPAAQKYLQWKEDFGWQLKAQMKEKEWEMILKPRPLALFIAYYLPIERTMQFDISNVLKGVEDAAQKIVFEDDCMVETITASRYFNAPKYLTGLWVGAHGG